jgi:hypothetical protein
MGKKNFGFEDFVKQAGEQLCSGKPLVGAEGVFTPLLKKVIEASLEGELNEHLKDTFLVYTNIIKGKNRHGFFFVRNFFFTKKFLTLKQTGNY